MELPKLNFPDYSFRLSEKSGKTYIFDPLRKKAVVLTPEEWVRQHLVRYLLQERNYPKGLTRVEAGISVYGASRRCDVLIYDRSMEPLLVAECKAPSVNIDQATFDQLALYNYALKAPYLVVTNGMQHYCCRLDYRRRSYEFLPDIPFFPAEETD